MGALFRLDAARDFPPLRQQKMPGQRKQSKAEKRRQRERFIRFDHVLLCGYARRVWKDIVFVGDQHGDRHHCEKENALPDGGPVAPPSPLQERYRIRLHKLLLPDRQRARNVDAAGIATADEQTLEIFVLPSRIGIPGETQSVWR